ncbi:MAG TPA: hypothetical protein VG146_10610 [Verrucomicrobiae bacterium]|nr:hypothetical protein [Verrucomicrobiae bacterium]
MMSVLIGAAERETVKKIEASANTREAMNRKSNAWLARLAVIGRLSPEDLNKDCDL